MGQEAKKRNQRCKWLNVGRRWPGVAIGGTRSRSDGELWRPRYETRRGDDGHSSSPDCQGEAARLGGWRSWMAANSFARQGVS